MSERGRDDAFHVVGDDVLPAVETAQARVTSNSRWTPRGETLADPLSRAFPGKPVCLRELF